MPSRWVCLLIVASWLAAMGWLFVTDVLPYLLPGTPPPFTIDLLDEVTTNNPQSRGEVFWSFAQITPDSDKPIKSHGAATWVRRYSPLEPRVIDWRWMSRPVPEDCFEVGLQFSKRWGRDPTPTNFPIQSMTSAYLVTQQGQLVATTTDIGVTVASVEVTVHFHGEVENGQLRSHYRLSHAEELKLLGIRAEGDLPPVPVSRHGSVLNPMQPLTRIRGLRLGEGPWDMPLVDPTADALGEAFAHVGGFNLRWLTGHREQSLKARVLPQVQVLTWRKKEKRCLVIDYQGRDTSAKTWVDEETGLVLRQEATREGVTYVFERESEIDLQP
jgi:hypothetical protein